MWQQDDREPDRSVEGARPPLRGRDAHPAGAAPGPRDHGLYDEQTGLPARILFWDRVEQALAWGDRHGGRLAVLLIDVSDVERTRERVGEEATETLMRQVGRRLVSALRKQDSVARTAEYEFAVLLPEVDSATGAATVAHKILRLFERHFEVRGHSVGVTPSIGAAVYPDHAFTLEALLGGAGVAKNAAREQGRGVFLVYTPGMSRSAAIGLPDSV